MTIPLATIQSVLKSWVSQYTGIGAAYCVWENEPRIMHRGTLAVLSWVSIKGVGIDDLRMQTTNIYENELSVQSVTLRKMVLQVSVETQDQTPGVNAMMLLEGMRGRVYHPSSTTLLRTADLGLIDMDDTTQSDYKVDGRMISRCVASVSFNQSDITTDDFGNFGIIEQVDITSELADVDDTQLPPQLQWDHHNIPE